MFIKREQHGMSVHFASQVTDKEGSGKALIQYSHVDMKEDLLFWLKENGRLPSATTKEYFTEIKKLNELQDDNSSLKEEN